MAGAMAGLIGEAPAVVESVLQAVFYHALNWGNLFALFCRELANNFPPTETHNQNSFCNLMALTCQRQFNSMAYEQVPSLKQLAANVVIAVITTAPTTSTTTSAAAAWSTTTVAAACCFSEPTTTVLPPPPSFARRHGWVIALRVERLLTRKGIHAAAQ